MHKKKKLLISNILPRIGASVHRRELTSFLENAELLSYRGGSALCLLCYLQQKGLVIQVEKRQYEKGRLIE
ncbi:hypothetical protein [Mastigocladopsis repens]|uniref:hypothetical protein n=1 Tax=Mastigocladopsis repens TaxID=221287 RepID=UPI00036C0BAB|nr:hypothetical protein [Mastigocladopsis repens]